MKTQTFCNNKFHPIQTRLASDYDRQARQYQASHNRSNPGQHIWRHILYRRTFYFFKDGQAIPVSIEIVRFLYAGTNRTFTFYGSLFLPFSRFAREFMAQAVARPSAGVALEVSEETVRRWALDLKLHNPSPGYGPPDVG